MIKKNIFWLLLIFFGFASMEVDAQCALYEVPLDQKINESNSIVEGEVISQTCFKSTKANKIYTLNTIKVYSILKGKVPHEIYIITAGGRLKNEMEIASSLLTLNVGNLGLFFLNKATVTPSQKVEQVYEVFASAQGFFSYNLPELIVADVFNKYSNVGKAFYKMLESNYHLKVTAQYLPIDWGNGSLNNRLTVINNFLPLAVNAGIGEKITINGFGFGNLRGTSKVLFKNADDGGQTEIAAEVTQYISWTDTKIVVEIPSKAATGVIAIEVGGTKAASTASLLVNYAIINTGSDALV
jgi:hypothetical protein